MSDTNFTCHNHTKNDNNDNKRGTSVSGESTRNRVYCRSLGLLGGSWCTVVWYLWYTVCDSENVASNSRLLGCDRISRSYTSSAKHTTVPLLVVDTMLVKDQPVHNFKALMSSTIFDISCKVQKLLWNYLFSVRLGLISAVCILFWTFCLCTEMYFCWWSCSNTNMKRHNY